MSRYGRDDDRDSKDREASSGRENPSREPLSYMEVAKQSRTLDHYKQKLADRGVTPERLEEWRKAITAWRALQASQEKATHSSSKNPSRNPERDYLAAAKQFRYREQYKEFLVKEWGLERGTKEWEQAQRDWELKDHLQDEQRHPKRGLEDREARQAEARKKHDLLKAAREAQPRKE